MCVQCMAGAVTAASGATGIRAWPATRSWSWLTPVCLRRMTFALIAAALVASALVLGGSTPGAPA